MGTSADALIKMDKIQQMKYVEKYLIKAKSAAGFDKNEKLSAGQLYALVFLPAKAKQEILAQRGEKYYTYNEGTDINKDGRITKSELDQRVQKFRVDESQLA